MTRSGTGGGLQDVAHSGASSVSNLRHETLVGGFLHRRSHHPGAGRASACPSSAEEGSKNVQSSDRRLEVCATV